LNTPRQRSAENEIENGKISAELLEPNEEDDPNQYCETECGHRDANKNPSSPWPSTLNQNLVLS
jgi:hypothetical protein